MINPLESTMATTHDSTHAGQEHADAWHTHAATEGVPQAAHTEEVPAFRVLGLGILLWFGVVVTIAVIAVYYLAYANDLQISSEEYPERFGGENQAVHTGQLQARRTVLEGQFMNVTPAWADAEFGLVTIPMTKAMDKVVARYADRK